MGSALAAWALSALACPGCPTARLVRASVMGDGFWGQLLVLAAPLAILGMISAALYRVGRPPARPVEDEP